MIGHNAKMFMIFARVAVFDRASAIPIQYWLAWLGSLALSIVLVMLLRTRWGQSRPLQKCALLSLLVHALLACLTMTIRVVVGEGGGGSGPPIHVRLVHDPAAALPQQPVSPSEAEGSEENTPAEPPVSEPPPAANAIAEVRPEQTDTPPPTPTASTAANDPLPQADPQPSEQAADVNDAIDSTTDIAASPTSPDADVPDLVAENPLMTSDEGAAPSVASSEQADAHVSPNEPVLTAQTDVGAAPATPIEPSVRPESNPPLAGKYALRSSPGRLGLVVMQGGSTDTEAAVAAALAWLARVQSQDGRWDANRFGAGQEQVVLDQNRGGAGRNADTGVSALALLAFLGAGHSHHQGGYQETVHRGLDFLMSSQAGDGSLFGESTFFAQMYCHSMSTFALAEAQAMTGDKRLTPALEKAVQYSLRTQNAATGGWRYRASYDPGDTSQLGWQMMALASAQRAGMDVPVSAWMRIGRFLTSVRRGPHGGLASYRPDGRPSASMTAEALYCRLILQEMVGAHVDELAATEATMQLLGKLPQSDERNLYYWYYATLAVHARHQENAETLAAWRRWNDALTSVLLGTQATDGPNAGSWDTNTVWGGYGGRVYTTAMAAMCLEVYYRYAPSTQAQWMAHRPTDREQPR